MPLRHDGTWNHRNHRLHTVYHPKDTRRQHHEANLLLQQLSMYQSSSRIYNSDVRKKQLATVAKYGHNREYLSEKAAKLGNLAPQHHSNEVIPLHRNTCDTYASA